ncbi:MAG: IclR family transcriptional regulator [Bacillota bacterium]
MGLSQKNTVRSVERALDIVSAMTEVPSGQSLTDLSRKTGLSVATVFRLVNTLMAKGFADQDWVTGKYRLGFRIIEIAAALLDSLDVVRVATPYAEELARVSKENVNLSVIDHDEALCLVSKETPSNFQVRIALGERVALHVGALSKALMAFLPEREMDRIIQEKGLEAYTPNTITDPRALKPEMAKIRQQGYAFSDGEGVVGARSVAAPIRNHNGQVIAAIAILAPATRMDDRATQEFTELILKYSNAISREMGYPEARGLRGS